MQRAQAIILDLADIKDRFITVRQMRRHGRRLISRRYGSVDWE
jgi:hypothetical protein